MSTSPRTYNGWCSPDYIARPIENSDLRVKIFTDGACQRNPGRGGYGIVIVDGHDRRELSGGFRFTTNNRMELIAAIVGLESLHGRRSAAVYTDSQYLAESMKREWARKWLANGWNRRKGVVKNIDLWERLLRVCARHVVEFRWIRGHAGHHENERCDRLATTAACNGNLPPDIEYEQRDCAPQLNLVFTN